MIGIYNIILLIATGGTARAAAELIEKVDGIVAAYVFVVELSVIIN